MSIGVLKFKLPEEREEFEQAQKAGAYSAAVFLIGQEIFRPARKHGYSDDIVQGLINKIGPDATALIGLLEMQFYFILNEHNINE